MLNHVYNFKIKQGSMLLIHNFIATVFVPKQQLIEFGNAQVISY